MKFKLLSTAAMALYLVGCSDGSNVNMISANADAVSFISSEPITISVLSNDLLGSVSADETNVTVSLIDNGGVSGASLSAGGLLSIPENSLPGIYELQYEICELENTSNCAASTISVSIESTPFTVSIQSNKLQGLVGTQFNLSTLLTAEVPGKTFSWTVSDGRTFDNEALSISFPQQGIYTVNLIVEDVSGQVEEDSIQISIFEAGDPTPDYLMMADRVSDLNDDGIVSLEDYLSFSQFVNGLKQIPDRSDRLVVDMNLDNDFSQADLDLLAEAILDESILPTAILSENDMTPFTAVTVVSPEFSNPEAELTITVGGVEQTEYTQTILGYLTFVIPEDVQPGSETRFLISDQNGVIFDQTGAVLQAKQPTIAENEVIPSLIELIRTEAETAALDLEQQFGSESEIVSVARENNSKIIEQLETISVALNEPALADFRNQVLTYMYANGFDEQVFQGDKFDSKLSAQQVCQIVDGICTYKEITKDTESWRNAAADVCTAAAVAAAAAAIAYSGGVSIPAAVPAAIGTIVTACAALEAPLLINETLYTFLEPIDFDFELVVKENADSVFNLDPRVRLLDGTGICNSVGGQGRAAAERFVADKIADVLEARLKRRIPRFLLKAIKADGGILQDIEDLFEDAAGRFLSTSGIPEKVSETIGTLCAETFQSDGTGFFATADLSTISFPSDQGSLMAIPDGTGEFRCSANANATVPVTAMKELCNLRTVSFTNNINCAGNTTVTVSFGDNGFINDDIFQVEIEGQRFSTNSPVRNFSFDIDLPSGQDIPVTMRGLAAPDGVGTYFISFSNASVVSGDPTSGSDLSQGATKNFVIRVN